MRIIFVSLFFWGLGCAEKAINNAGTVPLPIILPMSYEAGQEMLHRASPAAISGQLYLKNTISTLLSNTNIRLFKLTEGKWKLVTELSSDIEGKFAVTQKLFKGKYELRVNHPKYKGVLPITLNDKPETGLIFEVQAVVVGK